MRNLVLGILILLVFAGVLLYVNRSKTKSTKNIILRNTPTPKPTATQVPISLSASPSAVTPIASPTSSMVSASTAIIHTVKGDITLQLYPDDAPKTVKNFTTLAQRGYFNNLTFHRVVPGFVIQGGDPNGDGTGGISIYGPTFEDELNPNTKSYQNGYKIGVLAMANRGPNTNGSQFFIMLADHPELPHNYTIFGKVTSGMDIVQNIQVGDKMTTVIIQ